MRYEESRFRITTWPSIPLPHPPPSRPILYLLHPNGAFVPQVEISEVADPVPSAWREILLRGERLPQYGEPSPRYDEVYLQVGALDLDDDQTVLDFVNEFGLMNIRGRWLEPVSLYTSTSEEPQFPLLEAYPGFDDDEFVDLASPLRGGIAKAEAECRLPLGVHETIEEFRWGARCIRDLTAAWRCLRDDIAPSDLEWANPLIAFSFEGPRNRRWWDAAEMADFIAETLKASLGSLSPRVVVDHDDPPLPLADNFSTGISLFAVSCLELFNHIVEDAPYRVCGNARCGRLFVRQQGRAAHGQRRTTGVRYCSAYCSRSVAQRAYRERQKAART